MSSVSYDLLGGILCGKEKPADAPSRGIFPPSALLLPAICIPEELQQFLVDFDKQPLPCELELQARGLLPQPLPKPLREHTDTDPDYKPDSFTYFTLEWSQLGEFAEHLTPLPSSLRPHCLARDRLRLWKPANSSQYPHTNLSNQDLERIFNVMSNAWADSTREAYSSGILAYHVHCDKMAISEEQRAPTSQPIMAAFIANMAGAYSGSTVSNYVYGVRAWHILHSLEWRLNSLEMDALLKGAERLAPESSRRKKRQPYTPEFISEIHQRLDHCNPFDVAVFACLATCFYAAARVGEFLVPRLDAFDPSSHVTTANLRSERNQNNLEVMVLHIPKTKAAPIEGEDVFWSRHPGPSDPYDALDNHRRINNPSGEDHLFAYRHKNCLRPLTKPAFIKRIAAAARQAGLEPLQGHGIRIGATLFYLLQGVPFEAVKVMGRWSSDAFLRYLRKHAQILTPYIQANPELHDAFSRFIITDSQAILQGRR